MFDLVSYHDPYLTVGQTQFPAVLELHVAEDGVGALPASLAVALVIDRSASMDGPRLAAAKEAARQVVQAADDSVMLTVIVYNERGQVLVPLATCTEVHKASMLRAIDRLIATGGTCMSTGLTLAADGLSVAADRACKILFLTDGKNEGERRPHLERAVERCRSADIQVTAWGVGAAWDGEELRYIATTTLGRADVIPTPDHVVEAFRQSFAQMQKTVATQVRLSLWMPVGARLARVRQMYPDLQPVVSTPDADDPRWPCMALGSFARGEHRVYLLELEVAPHDPGQQYLVGRPSVSFRRAGQPPEVQAGERKAWMLAQWSADPAETGRVDPYVAHYRDQVDLVARLEQGEAALARGEHALATRLLGQALDLSQQVGNAPITCLLHDVLTRDPLGTVRLADSADALARQRLALHASRTSRRS